MLDAKEPPLRFSLATMITVLCLAGVYFAGMRFPSGWWAGATITLTIAILAVGLVWRFTSPRADRSFWNGFLIAGWTYVAFALAPQLSVVANAALLTPRILSYVHQQMPLTAPDTVAIEWHGTWYPGSVLDQNGAEYKIHYTGYTAQWDEWVDPTRIRAGGDNEFAQTGHAMIALLVAAAGGVVAKGYANRPGRILKALLLVAVSAWTIFGIVALFYPNDIVTSTVFTVSISVLIAITIGAVTMHSPRSPILIGAAVLGWCYFLVHLGPIGGSGSGPNLLTTSLIKALQDVMHPQTTTFRGASQIYLSVQPTYGPAYNPYSYSVRQAVSPIGSSFQIIGHSHLMLMAAMLGGFLGYLFSRRKGSKSEVRVGEEELIPTPPEA